MDDRIDRVPSASGPDRSREYWRSLEERLGSAATFDVAEFPPGAGEPPGFSRRDFLSLLGASIALAGVGGCFEPPREPILPYTVRPPEVTPGLSSHYATTMTLDGFGTGLLVGSREGRPTKVEGNPDHPASRGAAGVFEQASVLQLYDPNRLRELVHQGRPATWQEFARDFGSGPPGTADTGAGLRLLLEPTSSPLTAELVSRLRDAYPAARIYFDAPLQTSAALEGARLAFGRAFQPVYAPAAADVILSLDSDFLASGPFHLRYAREFADRRREPSAGMNRLYVVEAALSVTGGAADHRLRARTGEVEGVLEAILVEALNGLDAAASGPAGSLAGMLTGPAAEGDRATWIRAAARDLREHAGSSLVIAGDRQPPRVHALAHVLNAVLGNVGRTLRCVESPLVDGDGSDRSIEALAEEIRAGEVTRLLVLGGNPAYTAPADLDLARLIESVAKSAYLGLHDNETARCCAWQIPQLHYLETWGDARAYDGTASIVQPLIAPLVQGRTVDDVLSAFLGESEPGMHERLRESWRRQVGDADFEAFWAESLRRGVVAGTESPSVDVTPAWDGWLAALRAGAAAPAGTGPDEIELTFQADPTVYDGRFANNAWLQELPDPVTKLTWDNAALLSARTAGRLGVRTEEVIEIQYRGRVLRIPALVVPGHADDAITLPLGYGRTGGGEVARGVGANVYAIRTSDAPYFGNGARVRGVTERGRPVVHRLARTQTHSTMEGRPIVLQATLAEYRAQPDFTRRGRGRPLSLYRPVAAGGEQWAMTIDLGVCTGCSACVVACQAENNIPVVGRDGVLMGREMHWLRVDRYFSGDPDDPETVTQPMLCQHCEKAPCEYVCPVNATVRSPDGLNEMVYNRCIGTRFCANNCPYKVRRFNWFDYNAGRPESERLQLNPDVTVRARGVMEKCTYCVQRIRRGDIRARLEGRRIRDGEVRTACQQACPARAIVFGSLGDPDSEVSRSRADPRIYAVLDELGTEPRTRYLARITNPNAELAGETPGRSQESGGRDDLPTVRE